MTRSDISTWVCIAAATLVASGAVQARGEFCGSVPAPGFDQAPNRAHAVRYDNPLYGYSVAIPAPLSAYSQSGVAERGFGIVLSWTPRAYLSVDAAYDVYYDISAEGVHRRDINAIRLHDVVVADHSSAVSLAQAAGGRYVTHVQCAGSPQIYIHDDVIVVRNREIYRLNLQSVPERYAADVKVLDAMLRSWHWQPSAPPYVKK
ncbi:MAG: hypothetical protein ACHQDB_00975 [Steroidobacterales bacterium]